MVGIATSASFKYLVVELISETFIGMKYCFWFILCLDRGGSSGFTWFFHEDSPHSTNQRAYIGILPIVQYVYLNYAFQNWRNNHRMDQVTHQAHYEMDPSKNLISYAPTLNGEPQWHLGSPGKSVSSEPVSIIPEKSDYFLFPNAQSPGKRL